MIKQRHVVMLLMVQIKLTFHIALEHLSSLACEDLMALALENLLALALEDLLALGADIAYVCVQHQHCLIATVHIGLQHACVTSAETSDQHCSCSQPARHSFAATPVQYIGHGCRAQCLGHGAQLQLGQHDSMHMPGNRDMVRKLHLMQSPHSRSSPGTYQIPPSCRA